MKKIIKSTFSMIIIIASIIIVTASNMATIHLSLKNNLNNNSDWNTVKTSLKKGTMGAVEYLFGRQALANNRLNLSSWHGYNEIYYSKKINPGKVQIRFKLHRGAYINFLFDNGSEATGIRFSSNEKFKNMHYTLENQSFKDKTIMNVPTLVPYEWHYVNLLFHNDRVDIYLNDIFIDYYESTTGLKQRFGFRGSQNPAFIDEIRLYESNADGVLIEDFRNREKQFGVFIIAVLAILLLNLSLVLFQLYNKERVKRILSRQLLFSISLMIGSFVFLYYNYKNSEKYPLPERLEKIMRSNEEMMHASINYWSNAGYSYVLNNIKESYGFKPSEEYRIIFLGGSQTWGAGIGEGAESFVRIAERVLNELNPGNSIECINAAISGLTSSDIWELYSNKLVDYKPAAAVFNISSNDADTYVSDELFYKNLNSIININEQNDIKTIFILEPNSTEQDPVLLAAKHTIVTEIAGREDIPVIDLHNYLLERYDDGFLWWDYVHLTSYGHKIAGEYLGRRINKLID